MALRLTTLPLAFLINSETMSDDRGSFGPSVSCAGDVNGDGLDDLILGAYTADPNGKLDAGKSYVVFGKCSFGISIGITMNIDIISNTILSLGACHLDKA
jgi:hypothetical protein